VPVTYQVSAACHELPIRVTLSSARHLKAQPCNYSVGLFSCMTSHRTAAPARRSLSRHDVVGEVES